MAERKYPGYTASLPPRVRYDKTLPSAAILLYAEIMSMTDVTGFCWASNAYLGALIGVGKDRAYRLVRLLEERGYLETEVFRDEKNAVIERRIYVTDLGQMRLTPPGENTGRGPGENTGRGPGENTGRGPGENTGKNDIDILERIPPIVPHEGERYRRRAKNNHKDRPDWAPDAFDKLWRWYPGDKTLHAKRGNKQKAIRAWEKLAPEPELIDVIAAALAAQAESEEWQRGVGIPHLSTYLNNYGWEGWAEDGAV